MHIEKRGEPRYAVVVTGSLRNASESPQPIQITNLSAGGCRLVYPRLMGEGNFFTLAIGPVGPLEARVVWRAEDTHGIQFSQPLHPDELDHLRLFLSEHPALYAEGDEPDES